MNLIMDNSRSNTIVNIGTKETISVSELVKLICKISGKSPKILFDTSKPEGRFIKSSDTNLLSSIVEEEIVTISIQEGISRMIGWYKENF